MTSAGHVKFRFEGDPSAFVSMLNRLGDMHCGRSLDDEGGVDATALSDARDAQIAGLRFEIEELAAKLRHSMEIADQMTDAAAQHAHKLALTNKALSEAVASRDAFAAECTGLSAAITRLETTIEQQRLEIDRLISEAEELRQPVLTVAAPPPKSPEPLRAVAKVVKAKRRDKAESKPIVQPIVEAARKPKIGCAGLSVLTEGAKQVAPASDPNYDPQIQLGNIARVDVPNRKLYGPKACVDLPGSPMARALQHMQDGGLYGQDKIAKFGNFEGIEGLKTMMDLSRTLFKRAGLSVWSDKINMRLEAAAELGA